MKIIIAGGSGEIGSYLTKYFAAKGNEIVILSRHHHPSTINVRTVVWDAKTLGPWKDALEGAEMIINLAGKSVNCRYTAKNKKEILASRIRSTQILGAAVQQMKKPPLIWFNAASATIYRHAMDIPQDELSGEIGDDFSMNVCKEWEKCFYSLQLPETRKIVMRIAITLGIDGGVISRFKNLVRFGLGGKMADGEQMMSWVHVEDIARTIEFLLVHEQVNGVVNITSPYPVSNTEFMAALRKQMHAPFGIATPKWFLALGAAIIGTETELILKSRWVIPQKLMTAGFHFKYATIEPAIK